MNLDDYKFMLRTCTSSENEVTGEDIDIIQRFECDLKGVTFPKGARLFSPKIEVWKNYGIEQKIYPEFNFTVVDVRENCLVLETSFAYSSYSSTFEISLDQPKRSESIWFGRYNYSFDLTIEKRE